MFKLDGSAFRFTKRAYPERTKFWPRFVGVTNARLKKINLDRYSLRSERRPGKFLPARWASSVSDIHESFLIGPSHTDVDEPAALTLTEKALKRTMDVGVALTAVSLIFPLMLIAAPVIKLDSPGPVTFRQRRSGWNSKQFIIFKFRTMSVLENGPEVKQARRDDPRITRIGRFLRRSSIDEIPQLFNVLKGEMSLVGPRPHALAHDYEYEPLISGYARRRRVKPGITGWAQVNGLRGETEQLELMARRVELDLWYIEHWSVRLDVYILARTFFEIMRSQVY